MRRAGLALAGLLVVALVVAAVLWPDPSGGPAAAGLQPEPAAPPSAGAELEEVPSEPIDRDSGTPAGAGRTAASAPEQVAASKPVDPDELEIRGSIAVVDESGVEHAFEDGSFHLIARRGRGGRSSEVAVEAGAWRARVPRGFELSVRDVELGGRLAILEDADEPLRIPPDRFLELRASWLRGTWVHVRDALTGTTLNEVDAVRAPGWPRGGLPHPGEVSADGLIVRGASSPVLLPAARNRYQTFQLSCPEHTWGRLQAEGGSGGEHVVLLGPGGDLVVELTGGDAGQGAVLRVRDPSWTLVAELDLAGRRRIPIERLPVGRLGVAVEIGDWWNEPLVLGKGQVDIRAREQARLVLELEAAPGYEPVPLGGEIVLPTTWKLSHFLLVVELLDKSLDGRDSHRRISSGSMSRDDDRPEVWRWRMDDAQPGRYELELHPLYHSISLEVGPGGREDVVFEIPPPGVVRVRVLDAATGLEAEVENVVWTGVRPEWVRGGGMGRAERDSGTGLWELRAPQGEIEVQTTGAVFRGERKTVQAGPEPVELTLMVERMHRIELRLSDGSTPVFWPRGTQVESRSADGGESRRGWTGGSQIYFLAVEGPGTYRIAIPDIPGCEPIPEQEVYVGESGLAELEIELVRTP